MILVFENGPSNVDVDACGDGGQRQKSSDGAELIPFLHQSEVAIWGRK
jgi:hypothetical protein